jgi:hypothetical protein
MTSRQAEQAAQILRQDAPRQTHEVRRACLAAVEHLEREGRAIKQVEDYAQRTTSA